MSYTLGIDLGTTSVKVTIIDNQNLSNKVYSESKATASDIKGDPNLGASLQDVSKIYQTLLHLIKNAPQEVLDSVTSIGVCGQMHGIVYWKDKEAWTYNLKEELQVGSGVSYLHTWQDSRCSPEFLATLPPASTRVNSGYGCATTFWYLQNLPHFIPQFDRCGTVMDFLVSMILNQEVPVMSDQNAVSFGYYNPTSEDWDSQVLSSAGFPRKILPKVVPAGTCAGNLPLRWQGIKAGTPVFVAMGDFQASVKSMQGSEKEKYSLAKSIDFFPYFKNTDLAVAASLNGGNVLANFVSMIEDWTRTLGLDISEIMVNYYRQERGIKRIIGSGSALIKHKGLQTALQEAYEIPLVLKDEGDSSYGVALAVLHK